MLTRRAIAKPAVLLAVLSVVWAVFGYSVWKDGQPRAVEVGADVPDLLQRMKHPIQWGALEDLDLRGIDLRGRSLPRCEFWNTNLSGADLRGARLTECKLQGANLVGTRLDGIHLRGTTYDRFTRWPAGFRPEERGARLVE